VRNRTDRRAGMTVRFRAPLLVASAACLVLTSMPAPAQFLPFGRNKVAYTDFDWRVLKTEHFDIYFYPDMEDLARKGAHFAEESYSRLEGIFNFTILHRIPLIFYSSQIHFQQTNVTPGFIPEGVGGFFEFLKGRVVIPHNGSMRDFRHVIRHELVHVFMHNKIDDVLRAYNLPSERYPPLWFVEGLAEHYSADWDSQAEMLLRDAIHSGYFAPLSSIYSIMGSFLMYKEGQSILGFIEKEFGSEAPVRILENLWKSADFNEVMSWTLGVDGRELDRRWQRDLRKRYYPMAAGLEKPSHVSEAVSGEGFNSKPVIYAVADSVYVVHLSNVTGYSGIYLSSLKNGRTRLLLQGEKSDELEAFHMMQSRMSVSRDGILAFSAQSGGKDVLHLFDLRTERITATYAFPELVVLNSPSWAPDGARLVFSAMPRSGQSDLYILNTQDRTLEQLTNDEYDDRDPSWSPDGGAIVFSSDRSRWGASGFANLFAWDIPHSSIRAVAVDSSNFLAPSWSPDGGMLVFTNDRDGVHDVYAMKYDAEPLLRRPVYRVTRLLTSVSDPVWTDQGGIVFTAFENYSFRIRSIPPFRSRLDSLDVRMVDTFDEGGGWTASAWEGDVAAQPLRYEREYQLDIAQSQISTDPVFGTVGGAALNVSDLLGNDNFYFLLYNTAQSTSELLSSFNLAVSRISLDRRAPLAYGIYSFSGRRYDLLDPDQYFIERAYGGYLALAYPLSTFRRVEGTVSLTNSDKESLYEVKQRKALLLTNSISYVFDNALYYYTGPLDGRRMNVTLSFTSDVQYSNVNYYSIMADYRRYFRIGLRSALAARAEILYNHGKEARRYFLGGSWDLRGWPRWSIRGTKRWLTSCELRFPLLDRVGFDFPFGSMTLGLLRGALYFDAGNAWDDRYGETLGSVGAGLRFSLFGVFVLRYDFGKRIENNFRTIQSDMFHQFFFGWDF